MLNVFQFDQAMTCHRGNPTVILIGTSFQFSDQLLRLLRIGLEGVQFERSASLEGLSARTRITDVGVVVVHEAVDDLKNCIDTVRRELPGALVAIGCSNPAILRQIRQADHARPVSVLQMNVQVDVWFSVLRLLLSGHPYVPADLPPPASSTANHPENQNTAGAGAPTTGPARLTPREMEILPLIAQGKQNKVIASELGLSVHTVKLHSHNIFNKLGVTNRTGAANWYLSQMMDYGNVKAPRSDQG